MSADAWSISHSNPNYSGAGAGIPTFYGDLNNDGDFSDGWPDIAGISLDLTRGGVFGGSESTTDFIIGDSTENGDSAAMSVSLRIQNTTGATVNQWVLGMDFWDRSTRTAQNQVSNFNFRYSTDNVNFTTFQTVNGVFNTAVWNYTDIGGTVNATVANGGYLYFQMQEVLQSGGGSAWVSDNWAVTAIPEPGTLALLGIALGGLLLFRRRP